MNNGFAAIAEVVQDGQRAPRHGGAQPFDMSTTVTPYPPPGAMPLPIQMTDPFIKTHPMGTGFPPQQSGYGPASYRLGGID
jgi:hypothetical protein